MMLTETKTLKENNITKDLFSRLDDYSFKAKNLKNCTNYLIKQCSRISYKLKRGETLDSWEKKLIYKVNMGIYKYNKDKHHSLSYIDENNGFIVNAYFLFYYLKDSVDYKALYSTNAQIIIQEVCKEWKAYFSVLKEYNKTPSKFLGKPRTPGYLDSKQGRYWFTFTYQNIKVKEGTPKSKKKYNSIELPKSLDFCGLKIHTKKENIKQVKIKAENNKVRINIIYEVEDIPLKVNNNRYISIDLGVNNLMSVVSNTEMFPFIINGKLLKSMNHFYNKKKASLQSAAMMCNNLYNTKRMDEFTSKRNNKVNDFLHKVSKYIVEIAKTYNICKIIIGNNKFWKQDSDMGKVNNQNFVNIPYSVLIDMITYKAQRAGISVQVVEESYTSGTSYIDNELPIKINYNKSRRITRGLFKSNEGLVINSDINGAYQIMKKTSIDISYKGFEKISKISDIVKYQKSLKVKKPKKTKKSLKMHAE